jgi:hypothetical protein
VILTFTGRWFRKEACRINMSVQGKPMRDAIFMLAPVALVVYFVAYPDQFSAFLSWAGQFIR